MARPIENAAEATPARRAPRPPLVRALVLAVVAALGVGVPIEAALRPMPALLGWRIGPVEKLDPALAPFRPHLPAGARVGYVVSRDPKAREATNDDVGRFCAVQYALAPALVASIAVPECEAHGAAACGLTRVQFLVARGGPPAALAPMTERLGFSPLARAGLFVLLRREAP